MHDIDITAAPRRAIETPDKVLRPEWENKFNLMAFKSCK